MIHRKEAVYRKAAEALAAVFFFVQCFLTEEETYTVYKSMGRRVV